jgi:hypothetical protein
LPRTTRDSGLRRRATSSCALLTALAAAFFPSDPLLAADSDPALTASSRCPELEAVWSTVVKLVPGAASQLLAARPRVDVIDLGERYRVRVTTTSGVLERVYSDSARACDKRVRFAAEFIVLALLPPQVSEPTQGAASAPAGPPVEPAETASTPSSLPSVPTPPLYQPPPPPSDATQKRDGQVPRAPVIRLDLAGVAQASFPVLGAPGVLMWGGDLRVRIGGGRLGVLGGVGYLPSVGFDAGAFRGAILRVPAVAGLWTRLLDRSFRLDASAAMTAALERYEGVSPHSPSDATRLAPGVELGVTVSSRSLAGLAPILRLTFAWIPVTEELAAVPQGDVAATPSLWLGIALGMSLEL